MKTLVSFHYGRGGRFNNAGYCEYYGAKDFQELLGRFTNEVFFKTEDEYGVPLPDDQQKITDGAGNVLVEGAKAINADEGELDFDGDYDRYVVCDLYDCDEKQGQALARAFEDGEIWESDPRYNAIKGYLIDNCLIDDEEDDE